jgi:hypothetical protein
LFKPASPVIGQDFQVAIINNLARRAANNVPVLVPRWIAANVPLSDEIINGTTQDKLTTGTDGWDSSQVERPSATA